MNHISVFFKKFNLDFFFYPISDSKKLNSHLFNRKNVSRLLKKRIFFLAFNKFIWTNQMKLFMITQNADEVNRGVIQVERCWDNFRGIQYKNKCLHFYRGISCICFLSSNGNKLSVQKINNPRQEVCTSKIKRQIPRWKTDFWHSCEQQKK